MFLLALAPDVMRLLPRVVLVILLLHPALGRAQATRIAPAMGSMAFLLGEWEGSGWIRTGPGAPATFRQRETVRPAAGGAVVVIDGRGVSTVAGQEGRIVHEAFAVVSFDSAAHQFRWRAYRATGPELDVVPSVKGDTLVWGFPMPGGAVRFVIDLSHDGAWHEVGDFIRDGAPPSRFFEMTLRRRENPPAPGL